MGSINSIFRSLQYRNYRLFILGQSISLIGLWLQNVAMGWLVYRIANSALLLGVVGFVENIPALVLTPFAGVLVDRWKRHSILIITQTMCMLLAYIAAFLILTDLIKIWHIIVLSIVHGSILAVDSTARQSFWVDLVEDRQDLGNAIALNSTMFNVARLLGPTIAGIVIPIVGEGVCFLLNGISYIAVIAALLAMKIIHTETQQKKTTILQSIKEGFVYTSGFMPIKYTLLLIGLLSLFVVPYLVIMPVFASEILHGGPHTLGFLVSCSGVGALAGALWFAARKGTTNLAKLIPLSAGLSGISLILFSQVKFLWGALFFIIIVSFSLMIHIASCNTFVQSLVDDDKRGRVVSFFTMAFTGMTPFGNLLIGGLSNRIGVPNTLLICGFIAFIGAILFNVKRSPLEHAIQSHKHYA